MIVPKAPGRQVIDARLLAADGKRSAAPVRVDAIHTLVEILVDVAVEAPVAQGEVECVTRRVGGEYTDGDAGEVGGQQPPQEAVRTAVHDGGWWSARVRGTK